MATDTDRRIQRLLPALSARERAILALRAEKEGEAEDPAVRTTMPVEQVPEFNRLVRLMNAVNHDLAIVVLVIRHEVEELILKQA